MPQYNIIVVQITQVEFLLQCNLVDGQLHKCMRCWLVYNHWGYQPFGTTTDVVPVKRSPLVYGNDSMKLEIILNNLDCRGTESSLLECPNNVHNRVTQDCDDSELAGVRCGGRYYVLRGFSSCLV